MRGFSIYPFYMPMLVNIMSDIYTGAMENYIFTPEPENATEVEQRVNDLHAEMGEAAAPYYMCLSELVFHGSADYQGVWQGDRSVPPAIAERLKQLGTDHALAIARKQAVDTIGTERFDYLSETELRGCKFAKVTEIYRDIIVREKYTNTRLARTAGGGMTLIEG